ncbi:unnamed protein product, partial [Bubo scandiacus]
KGARPVQEDCASLGSDLQIQGEQIQSDAEVGNQFPLHLQRAPDQGGAQRGALQTAS